MRDANVTKPFEKVCEREIQDGRKRSGGKVSSAQGHSLVELWMGRGKGSRKHDPET